MQQVYSELILNINVLASDYISVHCQNYPFTELGILQK